MRPRPGWTVTEVAAGRFLLEIDDPSPWYADEFHPDPEAVEQARLDFGSLLLTQDVADAFDQADSPKAHYRPW